MNELEQRAFKGVFDFYSRWRDTIIEGDEMWEQFAADFGQLGQDLDVANCPLALHLMDAMIDTFSDLYRDGLKPVPANYFGRNDL